MGYIALCYSAGMVSPYRKPVYFDVSVKPIMFDTYMRLLS